MTSGRYMGPSEVQNLILGKWVDVVGRSHRGQSGAEEREREREKREAHERWLREQQQQQQYGQYGQGQYGQYGYSQQWQPPYQQPWQPPYQQPYQQPTPGQMMFPNMPGGGVTNTRDHRQPWIGRGGGGGGGHGGGGGGHWGGGHGGGRWGGRGRWGGWGGGWGYDGGDGVDVIDDGADDMMMVPDPGDAVAVGAHHGGRRGYYGGYPYPYPVIGHQGQGNGGPSPAAWLVEQPLPDKAERWILPMSTGVPILPTQSAQITGRPQAMVFRVERFIISNAGTSGGAADWIVNDIKIGNQSQFVQSGDVPGDMFATNTIDAFVSFRTAQTAMDVVVVCTYIGMNESGVPFYASMLGTAAV